VAATRLERVKATARCTDRRGAEARQEVHAKTIEVVVDRVVVREASRRGLADSFEPALELAGGIAYAEKRDGGERTVFSARFACPESGFTIEEIEPRLFSFNSPQGACPTCDGSARSPSSTPPWWCPMIAAA
jgi:excinuclease ABC subunit A